MEAAVTKRLMESFNWPKSAEHMKVAILEDIENKPILERSIYGAALAQARAYAIYDSLSRSEVFAEKHKPFWFANVQISGEALSSIRMSAPQDDSYDLEELRCHKTSSDQVWSFFYCSGKRLNRQFGN